MNVIKIGNVEYVRKDMIKSLQEVSGDFVIVRCRNAGVHAGTLVSRDGNTLELANSRRLWKWWSKFSLSGLAMSGVLAGKESECRFACILPKIQLTSVDVCEVISCTEVARESILSIADHSNE